MPKETRTRIPRTQVADPTPATRTPGVYAAPVALPNVAPSDDIAGALLRGLSTLNPALSAISERLMAEKRAEQTAAMRLEEERETAAGSAEGYRAKRGDPVPAHKTAAWAAGYLSTQGRMAGIEDGQEWSQFVQQSLSKPDFDFHKERADFIKRKQDGLAEADKSFAEAYLQQFASADASVMRARTTQLVKEQEDARDRATDVAARDLVLDPAGPLTFHERFRAGEAAFLDAGGTRDQYSDRVVNQIAAVADETGRLDLLKLGRVGLNDKGTWFLEARPEYSAKLKAVERRIIARNKAEAAASVDMKYVDAHAALKADIESGVYPSPTSASAAIQGLIDKFPTRVSESEALSLMDRAYKGIAKARESAEVDLLLQDPDRLRVAPTDMRQKARDRLEATVGAIRFTPENIEKSSTQIASTLMQIKQMTGLKPVQLKQMFSFASMEAPEGAEPPAAALGAIRVWEKLEEQHATIDARDLMTAEDQAVLMTFQRYRAEGKDTAQAWHAAKQVNGDKGKDRMKELYDRDQAKWRKEISSKLNKVFANSWFSMNDPDDMGDLTVHVTKRVREGVGAGMTPEMAIDDAISSVEKNVIQVDDRMIFVPPTVNMDRETLATGLKASARDLGGLKPTITLDGAAVIFSKTDGTGSFPIPMQVIAENAQKELAGPIATQRTAQASESLRMELTGHAGGKISPSSLAKLTDERVYQIKEWASDAVARGQLSRVEHINIKDEVRARDTRKMRELLKLGRTFREQHGLKPGPLSDGDVVAVGTVKPGDSGVDGVPGHNDIALKHATVNPTAALTVAIEGFKTKAYSDPAKGGGLNIAAGYSLTNKSPTKVIGDLLALGITEVQVKQVMAGKASLSVDQAMALTQRHLRNDVEPRAKATFDATAGSGSWQKLSHGERAALTYIEWSVKGGLGTYPKLMEALKKGDQKAALDEYTIGFVNHGGTKVQAGRAMALARAMMRGTDSFIELLKKGI